MSRTCLNRAQKVLSIRLKTLLSSRPQPFYIIHAEMAQLDIMKRGKLFLSQNYLMGFIESRYQEVVLSCNLYFWMLLPILWCSGFLARTICLVIRHALIVMDKSRQLSFVWEGLSVRGNRKKPFRLASDDLIVWLFLARVFSASILRFEISL